jgi:predicted nucleic acid-binding protein
MTAAVVDASVIGPILIPDESDDLHPRLLKVLEAGTAMVPLHWHLEVANIGLNAVRRRRLTLPVLQRGLADLAEITVSIDEDTWRRAWDATAELAARHRLTIYDAAYLELAIRKRASLISADHELNEAAKAESVELL